MILKKSVCNGTRLFISGTNVETIVSELSTTEMSRRRARVLALEVDCSGRVRYVNLPNIAWRFSSSAILSVPFSLFLTISNANLRCLTRDFFFPTIYRRSIFPTVLTQNFFAWADLS